MFTACFCCLKVFNLTPPENTLQFWPHPTTPIRDASYGQRWNKVETLNQSAQWSAAVWPGMKFLLMYTQSHGKKPNSCSFCMWIQTSFSVFFAYSSHLLPHRHTPWLLPARATTAVAVALQAGTNSAKLTSTSEACPLQPQTMTWSSSVSREYYTSSHHYLLLISHWFLAYLVLVYSLNLQWQSLFDIHLLKFI